MVCWLCIFVECCTDTKIIQPKGVLECRQFGTSQEEDPPLFSLISSISLAEQPSLVVAKTRSSCATIRQPWFLRIVSRIHRFSAEGHFLVPTIGSASNWMPRISRLSNSYRSISMTPLLLFHFLIVYPDLTHACDVVIPPPRSPRPTHG